jgi:nitrate/nitrite transporter NarK
MKNDNLKIIILYVLASTGAILFFLAIIVMFKENKSINADTILQIIGANVLINLGLFLTHKVEFRYAILEFLLDISLMTSIIIIAEIIFKWYSKISAWVPLIIVLAVYILFYLLDIVRVRKDIKEINKLCQKYKEKEADSAC